MERVQAAVEVARALPFPFTLTARAENFLHGRTDLDDTIRRLQAFEAAGADVLYAPGLSRPRHHPHGGVVDRQAVQSGDGLCRPDADASTNSPTAGVKRISVGGAMARYALAAFLQSAREMKDQGAFTYVREMAPIKERQGRVQVTGSLRPSFRGDAKHRTTVRICDGESEIPGWSLRAPE